MQQDKKQLQEQVQNLLPKAEDIAGFSVTYQNQPPSSEDMNVFTNFEADLDEQSQKLRTLLLDRLIVQPKSKNVKTHQYPVKIINDSEYQFYNFQITHKNKSMQSFSERRLYTKYLASKKQKSLQNYIEIINWPFYEQEQTSVPLTKEQKKGEQKTIKQAENIKKYQEETGYLKYDEDDQNKTQQEKKKSEIQAPQSFDYQQVDAQEDERGTDCIVISFYRKWKGKFLAFTNKPQIRYRQNYKPQQFKVLQFSIKDYNFRPQLKITISQKGPFSFGAQLQIAYTDFDTPLIIKHSVSLISKQVDRDLNNDTSYEHEIRKEMEKQVNSGIKSNKNAISFGNEQQIIEKILKGMIRQKQQTQENLQDLKKNSKLYFKQYKIKRNQINEDDICLYQGNLGNCYMTSSFNQFEQVWPGYLQQRGIIMFDKKLQTICVALNINGSKVYIKTDYKLPCFQVKYQNQEYQNRMPFSYPSFVPQIVKQQQLVNKHLKQQQKIQHADQNQSNDKKSQACKIEKYLRILPYLYVQKCIALYYGSYEALKSGNPAEIVMMLSDGITDICDCKQVYKYKTYFSHWRDNTRQDKKPQQKYVIIPSTYKVKKYSNEAWLYFKKNFGEGNERVFQNHSFSFAGFYQVGDKKQLKTQFIIKIRDYRRKKIPQIKELRQFWLHHQRNKKILEQLKTIDLKDTQFLINFQDIDRLGVHFYIGVISHNYHYSSRQVLLQKGKVSHYKLTIKAQTECQVILTQTSGRHFSTNMVNTQKYKHEYSKMGLELTLSPQIKLNIFQKYYPEYHISWLKCFLWENEYDLKIGLKQSVKADAKFEFVTLGFRTKNRLDQIQLASHSLTPLEIQDIYCKQVKNYKKGILALKTYQIATPNNNNYFSIEHQNDFLGLELTIYQWEHGECFGQNFDIWMHKLDVQKEDYFQKDKSQEKTIRINKMNYFKKNNHKEYSLLIFNENQFKAGFYKIIVSFKKDENQKPKTSIKSMKVTFTIRQEDYVKKELKNYTQIDSL